MTTRRSFLKYSGAAVAALSFRSSLAFAATPNDARFVFVILRGGMDGMAAAVPFGDPHYKDLRGPLTIAAPGQPGGALDLDGMFGLHPSLETMHGFYKSGELAVLHAIATPYRDRSHFDAQNVLENGTPRPMGAQDGWLNRAIATLPKAMDTSKPLGLAAGENVPLVLRGKAPVTSWAPSALPSADDDTINRLMDLYQDDKLLGSALAEAVATDKILKDAGNTEKQMGGRLTPGNPAKLFKTLANSIGTLMADAAGPRVGVIDLSGWDTHANQGAATGGLAGHLRALDTSLGALKDSMGAAWGRTAVLVATEFGRTAHVNGTNGTDHGTGGVAFLMGGAVNGGRVVTDWPGLATAALYQQRDLKATTDLRSVIKGVLADHLHMSTAALNSTVFPESGSAKPHGDLIRA